MTFIYHYHNLFTLLKKKKYRINIEKYVIDSWIFGFFCTPDMEGRQGRSSIESEVTLSSREKLDFDEDNSRGEKNSYLNFQSSSVDKFIRELKGDQLTGILTNHGKFSI